MSTQHFTIQEQHDGQRLDLFLADQLSISRSAAKRLIDAGEVMRNAKAPKKAGDILKQGDEVLLVSTPQTQELLAPATIGKEELAQAKQHLEEVSVIHESDDYIVINKPAGVVVHPNDVQKKHTLVSWLLAHYPEVATVGDNPQLRPGIVHRLDKDASGVLVVARTQAMFDHLKKQFQLRTVDKQYTVLVHGQIEHDYAEIDFPIDRGKDGKYVARPSVKEINLETLKKMQPGKKAYTQYWVEKRFLHYSLLRVHIHTGRTHQIRVHMYAIDHPVVGDTLYAKKTFTRYNNLDRLFLHAAQLSFLDMANTQCVFKAELPSSLTVFLDEIKT